MNACISGVVGYRIWGARCCNIPTEQIIAAQKFNYAPKFPQNGNGQPQFLYFWKNFF